MRFRGKSIRRKIVALLLVPLASLTTLWAFTTVITGREASHLFDVSSVMEEVGYPVEDTVRVLQQERRQTLVHLADPRASDGLTALERSRTATDRAVAAVRRNASGGDVREAMHGDSGKLDAALDSFEGIQSLRRSIDDGTLDRRQALDLYNRLIDPCYVLLADLHVVEDVELDTQYRALVNLARARELLSREDALLGSALIVGKLSPTEVRDVSDLTAQRTLLYDVALPQLPVDERDRYETFWSNATTAPLRVGSRPPSSPRTERPAGSPPPAGTPPPARCSPSSAPSTTRPATGIRSGCGPWPWVSSPRPSPPVCSAWPPCSSPCSSPCAWAGNSSATSGSCAWRPTRPPVCGCPA